MDDINVDQAPTDVQQETPIPEGEQVLTQVTKKSKLNFPIVIGGGVVVVALAAGGLALVGRNNANTQPTVVPTEVQQQILEAVQYKDGTYYVETSFYIEAAEKTDFLGITVVIQDEKIVSAEVTALEDGEAVESGYLDTFNDELNGLVIGKTIDETEELESPLVAGSTLTSNAFVEALPDIQLQEVN
ncbi:MAG: hypothetical protein ACE5DX_04420 [Candidatus Dojkabacteria bacterium]